MEEGEQRGRGKVEVSGSHAGFHVEKFCTENTGVGRGAGPEVETELTEG